MIKRGEVYWAGLDPAVGGEMRKTRPVVVVSNDVNNVYASTVTIVPLTSSVRKVYPFEVLIRPGTCGNRVACKARVDQVRTMVKRRLRKEMGRLPDFLMSEIDQSLKFHLAL